MGKENTQKNKSAAPAETPGFSKALPFLAVRPLVGVAACYGLGLFIGSRLFLSPYMVWALGAAALLTLLCKVFGKKIRYPLLACCLALGVLLGALAFHPNRPPEGTYAVSGTVAGTLRLREDGQVACTLRDVTLNGEPVNAKGYWTYYLREGEESPAFGNGDSVSFLGRLYHPSGQENPHGFDFDKYLLQQGITFGLYGSDNLASTSRTGFHISDLAYDLRASLTDTFIRLMGERNGAIAATMVLGAKEGMPQDIREDFRRTGIAHILAISGLHVGILAGIFLWLLKKLGLGAKGRLAAMTILLGLYCWLVGGSPSVLRASILCITLLASKTAARQYDGASALSFAFFLILLARPADLFSAGFQLSFGAVAGILLLRDPLSALVDKAFRKRKKRPGKIHLYLRDLFCVGLAAQLGVALPMALWYQEFALMGLLLNLVVIPYVGLMLPLYLVTLLLSPLGFLGQWAGWAASLMTDMLIWFAGITAKVPGMVLLVPAPRWPVALGGAALLVLSSRYTLWRGRRRLMAMGLTVLLCLPLQLFTANRDVRYIQLSLGQEDSAILEDGFFTAVIDVGTSGQEAAAYLRGEGRAIDALLLTHLHLDHVGGVETLLSEGIVIRTAYVPFGAETALADTQGLDQLALLREAGVPIVYVGAGDVITTPRAALHILWPYADKVRPGQDANHYSMVLALESQGTVLLSTGDGTSSYEEYAALSADILKVAHHGSRNSTSAAYLNLVEPSLALISCASGGALPSAHTLDRLDSAGVPYLRTDVYGAITVVFREEGFTVTPFRKDIPLP